MIKIIILNTLREEIFKTFKKDAVKIYSLVRDLQLNPHKGKYLGRIAGIDIKELRFNSFRFYFLVDSYKYVLFSRGSLYDLLIKFVKMSKKNDQQKAIEEIQELITFMGFDAIE